MFCANKKKPCANHAEPFVVIVFVCYCFSCETVI